MNKASNDGYDRWNYDSFEIMQAFHVSGYQAVLCDDEGLLYTEPVEFLAVCKVTTIYLKRRIEDRDKHIPGFPDEDEDEDVRTEIVPLYLMDGFFQFYPEGINYAGLCKVGDDIEEATGCLGEPYYEKHRQWKKARKLEP